LKPSIPALALSLGLLLCSPTWAQEPLADQPWFSVPLAQFLDHPSPIALGWSSAGRVALLVPIQGVASPPAVRLVVVDAVEDRVVFDAEARGEGSLPGDATDLWARNLAASDTAQNFLQACMAWGIQPASPQPDTLGTFPFSDQGSEVAALVESTNKGYRLVVTVAGRGAKTIANVRGDFPRPVVEGYFLSPFEPRILVVYTADSDQGQSTFRFSGCHLKVGFEKK